MLGCFGKEYFIGFNFRDNGQKILGGRGCVYVCL